MGAGAGEDEQKMGQENVGSGSDTEGRQGLVGGD